MNDPSGLNEPSDAFNEGSQPGDPAGADAGPSVRDELFQFLQKELGDWVARALPAFDDVTLLSFEWRDDSGKQRHFRIQARVQTREDEKPSVSFELSPGDESVVVTRWFTTRFDQKFHLEYHFFGSELRIPVYEQDDFVAADDGTRESYVAKAAHQTRRARDVPDHDEFARLWFSDESQGREFVHSITPTRTAQLDERLRDVGPFWREGSWQFQRPRLEVVRREDGSFAIAEEEDQSLGRALAAHILANAAWRIMLRAYAGGIPEDGQRLFPGPSAYTLRRPVDLKSEEVIRKLQSGDEKLYFPRHVIDAACTSLNSGKNVIFTGPPGCGKTQLAVQLAKLATDDRPVLATGSPAWTTDELLGRYLPRPDGNGLEFDPGFFLKAVEDRKWLLVDEMNRADIDRAFGELFSVLAGETAELPFQHVGGEDEADGEEQAQVQGKRVRIVPHARAEDTASSDDDFRSYHVAQDFRLLGTMNDADRSRLHQLSYAFQRRFNIIRVEAPPRDVVAKLIDETALSYAQNFGLTNDPERDRDHRYRVRKWESRDSARGNVPVNLSGFFADLTKGLCANAASDGNGTPRDGLSDLVQGRIIGVATVLDMIRFVAEGLRAPTDASEDARTLIIPENDSASRPTDAIEEWIKSLLGMAVVLSVFPQLDAHADDTDRLLEIVEFTMEKFRDSGFRRIESTLGDAVDGDEASNRRLLKKQGLINDYLARELALRLGRSGDGRMRTFWESLRSSELITRIPRQS